MSATRLARRQYVDFRGSGGRLLRLPGLDGLRGAAVAGVVLFPTDLGLMVGGYLGVSTFFTLSGFLITSLLLNESVESGSVDLRSFWGRRFRRLLPASLVTLFVVSTLFAWEFATAEQLDSLRAGVWAALAQVANWQLIFSGASYGDLFAAPSPVVHFWSLAIEEQFYLVFPLLMVGLWALTRGRKLLLGAVLAGLALCSALAPFVFTMSHDRIYFGTDTRSSELLLGAVLAVVLSHRPVRARLIAPTSLRAAVLTLGALLAAVQLYLWITLPQSSSFLYHGGFAVYAVMTCVIITAASLPRGPVETGLTITPLLWLGERSYGLYLVHWPVFLAFRQTWTTAPTWMLAIAGIATSLVLAELSYRYVEQPIRQRRSPVARHFVRFAAIGIVVVALCAAVLPTNSADPDGQLDFEQAAIDQKELLAAQAKAQAGAPSTTAAPMQVSTPTLATFGDSTALLLGLGMLQYATETGTLTGQEGDVALGCGVSRFVSRMVDEEFDSTAECRSWPERWQAVIDRDTPNIAQLVTGSWEVTDAKIPGADDYSAIGAPEVDAFIKSELTTAVDILGSRGAMVILVLWPRMSDFVSEGATPGVKSKSDPVRMTRLHDIMREIAAERPGSVRILDLGSMLADRLQDTELRPDGIHIPAEQANLLYQQELGAETIRLWTEFWRESIAELTTPTTTIAEG